MVVGAGSDFRVLFLTRFAATGTSCTRSPSLNAGSASGEGESEKSVLRDLAGENAPRE